MPAFTRSINVEMDWIDESSFEIRGSLDDHVHSLSARLVVSYPDFIVRAATGEITRMPYMGYCTGATGALAGLEGHKIGRGFRRVVGETLGGAASCNHLHTLVTNMASCAFQMNYIATKAKPEAQAAMRETEGDLSRKRQMVLGWMPQLRNSCYIFIEANYGLFEKPVEDGSKDAP